MSSIFLTQAAQICDRFWEQNTRARDLPHNKIKCLIGLNTLDLKYLQSTFVNFRNNSCELYGYKHFI